MDVSVSSERARVKHSHPVEYSSGFLLIVNEAHAEAIANAKKSVTSDTGSYKVLSVTNVTETALAVASKRGELAVVSTILIGVRIYSDVITTVAEAIERHRTSLASRPATPDAVAGIVANQMTDIGVNVLDTVEEFVKSLDPPF